MFDRGCVGPSIRRQLHQFAACRSVPRLCPSRSGAGSIPNGGVALTSRRLDPSEPKLPNGGVTSNSPGRGGVSWNSPRSPGRASGVMREIQSAKIAIARSTAMLHAPYHPQHHGAAVGLTRRRRHGSPSQIGAPARGVPFHNQPKARRRPWAGSPPRLSRSASCKRRVHVLSVLTH